MGQLMDILKRIWAIETVRMLFIAAGIMVCFLYFGIMQGWRKLIGPVGKS